MRSLSRTCLVLCTCCIIALGAISVRVDEDGEGKSAEKESADDFDFDFDHFIDVGDDDDDDDNDDARADKEEKQLESLEKEGSHNRRIEPEAEMLPANYKGVKPPGVDHMEMTRIKRDELPIFFRALMHRNAEG